MKRKVLILVTAVTTAALVAVGGTLAWFTDKAEISNVVTMGNVNIKLEEPVFSSSFMSDLKDGAYVKKGSILPGDSFVKDPTITNIGNNPCYIRAKVQLVLKKDGEVVEGNTVMFADEATRVIAAEDFFSPNDGWAKNSQDGYYYYTGTVPTAGNGSSVALFKAAGDGSTIHVPAAWGNEIAGISFELSVTAEAVQSEHFTPETGLVGGKTVITGWNGITPETYHA